MAYRVIISDPANADLDAAIGYIAVTLEAPGAAATLLDEYEEKLRLIADNPKLFGVDLYVSKAVDRQIRRCRQRHQIRETPGRMFTHLGRSAFLGQCAPRVNAASRREER